MLEEQQRQFPSIQTFPVQFGKKHAQQADVNRPGRSACGCLSLSLERRLGSACSIGRSLSQQFGGSSSTVNELCLAPSSTAAGTPLAMTSTRRIFASDSDVRGGAGTRSSSAATPMSSSTLRPNAYHQQVTYTPQSSAARSLSVHPQPISSPSYPPETSSVSTRPTSTNANHHYTSSTSLNSTTSGGTLIPTPTSNGTSLAIKSIDPLSKGTYRVTFNDGSVMILRADCTDGQLFIDLQGKRYLFDRRQQHQPEAIQERLALMQQDQHAFVESSTSQPAHQLS